MLPDTLEARFDKLLGDTFVEERTVVGFSVPNISWQQLVAWGLEITVKYRRIALQRTEDGDAVEIVRQESQSTFGVVPLSLSSRPNGDTVFVGIRRLGEIYQDNSHIWTETYTITVARDGEATLDYHST